MAADSIVLGRCFAGPYLGSTQLSRVMRRHVKPIELSTRQPGATCSTRPSATDHRLPNSIAPAKHCVQHICETAEDVPSMHMP